MLKSTLKTSVFAAVALFFSASLAMADLKMPKVFSDNMVLQRDMVVPVWGWDAPGTKVSVSIGDAKAQAVAGNDGKWMAKLPKLNAGGPFELTISGTNKVTIANVLVGEVWLCSGQSNMQWTVSQSEKFDEEKELAKANGHIRHFGASRVASPYPQNDVPGAWNIAAPDTVGKFTAAGYFFARELSKVLPNVPIGIINSSWGGTRIEPWTPPEGFATVSKLSSIHNALLAATPQSPVYKEILSKYLADLEKWHAKAHESLAAGKAIEAAPAYPATLIPKGTHRDPAGLYNAMIHPLIPYAIKGALWYQGEANLREGMLYYDKKQALVNGWRKLWGQGDFPFFFVQLAPYKYGDGKVDSEVMGIFWEAQAACEKIPGVGMAVINDIGNVNDIHPRKKQEVGRRLCLLAQAKVYGMDVVYSGPKFEKMAIEGDTIRVFFTNAEGLSTRDGKAPDNFEIIGTETEFMPATAKIEGNSIVLSNPAIKEPKAMRFAWHKLSEPNLKNGAGLPCGAFRAGTVPVLDYLKIKIPQAKEYELVYDLEIGKGGANIKYDIDNSAKLKGKFDKVAYFLELQKNGKTQYVFVSMDPFTDDIKKIGVPTFESKAVFQTKVNNLTVISNAPGVKNVENMANAGCIEFWACNYSPKNASKVPGATDDLYDFGDEIGNRAVAGYGSMQVHNYAAKQTVFAYNKWSNGIACDLGIGNSNSDNAKKNQDWTFTSSGSTYNFRRLRVLVRMVK